jgi:hypothetical protein
MTISQNSCPWSVPVPVETSRFVSLFPAHAELNVQTVPLAAFGSRAEACPTESLLYADLQTMLYSQIAGRLGSGRAGFYRGWYLKGVGRTPLAANWNCGDHLHSSGHMAASSAIREYVASLYLQEQGCGGSIVPCEGVLLAELDPHLRSYHDNLYGPMLDAVVPRVDRYLQAISVKSGSFARQTNFIWLLHNLTPASLNQGNTGLGTFCELMAAALAGDPTETASMTPDRLIGMLAMAVSKTLEHFRVWFEHGVWWGSFGNNFTLDGRFLDLETPALLGGPFAGYMSASGNALQRWRRGSVVAFEQLTFIAQTRAFCIEAVRILDKLPRSFTSIEREFGAALAGEIEAQILAPDQILGSRDRVHDQVMGMLEATFGRLSPGDHAAVHRLLAAEYDRRVGDGWSGELPVVSLSPIPGFPDLLVEPGPRLRPLALTLESGRRLGPSEQQVRQANRWADVIADLDQTTSLPILLDKLAALSAQSAAEPATPLQRQRVAT